MVLLYYLSQNPDFTESVKPLMNQLKNSEQMLGFLKDLSNFTQTFSTFQAASQKGAAPDCDKAENTKQKESSDCSENSGANEKTPQSPTSGIADAFIQEMLESYLKKR